MKRLKVLGIITLVVVSTLLVAAGSGWNDGKNLDPNSHVNVPFAVVKDVTGNDTTIYFGELIKDPYKDRYLMVANSNSDSSVNNPETLMVTLCPGPGVYDVYWINKGICYIDESVTPYDTTYCDSLLCTDTTNDLGEISITISLRRGEGALFHLDPGTLANSDSSLVVAYNKATSDVTGRKVMVDRYGRIHVCYTDKAGSTYSVWYARSDNADSTWQEQKISNNALCPAISVDTFGIPWVTYMTSDRKKLCIWSEGFYDTLLDYGSVMNDPAIALDFEQGLGAIYTSNNYYTSLHALELPSLKQLYISPSPTIHLSPVGSSGSMSCCISSKGDAVAVEPRKEILEGYPTFFCEYLYTRIDKSLSQSGDPTQYYTGSGYSKTSISRQLDKRLWVAYYQPTTHTVRYKRSDTNYVFPSGSGTKIDSLSGNYYAPEVQIANDAPIVVWTCAKPDTSWSKIYYSYRLPGTYSTWSEAARVSTCGAQYLERYPHVAVDYKARKAYIIWTQYTDTCSGDTIVNCKALTFEAMGWDSVRVIKPNGPPPPSKSPGIYTLPYYMLGQTLDVVWSKKEGTTDTSFVYANYNFNPSNPSAGWAIIDTAFGNDTTVEWKTKQAGTKCRVKVVVKYGTKVPYDISDADFEIRNCYINPTSPVQYEQGGINKLAYTPGNSSKSVTWEAFSICGLSGVNLMVSKDAGASFTSYADSSSYDSTLTDTIIDGNDTSYAYTYSGTTWWTTPATPTSNGCLKLMAVNSNSDTAYSDLFDGFAIAPPGGNQYATSYNQRLIAEGKASGQIGIAYRGPILTSSTGGIIYYLNSAEGLDFDEPDSVGLGLLPTQEKGCVAWLSGDRTQVRYTNWNQTNQAFNNSTNILIPVTGAITTKYTPPALKVINDTVNIISIRKNVVLVNNVPTTFSHLIRLRFLKDYPGSPQRDSVSLGSSSGYDTTGHNAMLLDIQGSNQFASFVYKDTCRLVKYPITASSLKNIGKGICPTVSCSQGNITYSYIANDSTSLIRLWGYRDDTSWVERDTIPLDTSLNYETMTSSKGLMFGAQHEDTSLAELYVYDPISEELYSMRDYEGYYPHPYIDNESSEFNWVDAYSEVVDTETINLHTERQGMNVIIPELYLESRDKRSPFTLYRDTCIHYTAADVDSGTDSLKYRFPYLDDSKDYTTIVEFYTDEDIADTLEITLGSNVDTISIPGNNYSWYEQNIASNTDTMNLKIKKLSVDGFIPVSRVMVRERSDSGLFMMKGRPIAGPEKIVFCLFQPNPNPFSDAATIRYSLPYETNVSLKVYDISGRLVNTLVQGKIAPGVHTIRWEGKDNINRKCASGVYFVRFIAADYRASKKMVMLK